jgi:hypothetical protein
LDDPELRIIQDLGPAGRSKAITDGFIATMKALEVATALNNPSLESEIRVNALAQERDALTAKVAALGRMKGTRGQLPRSVKLPLSRRLTLPGSWPRKSRPCRRL